MEKSYCQQ